MELKESWMICIPKGPRLSNRVDRNHYNRKQTLSSNIAKYAKYAKYAKCQGKHTQTSQTVSKIHSLANRPGQQPRTSMSSILRCAGSSAKTLSPTVWNKHFAVEGSSRIPCNKAIVQTGCRTSNAKWNGDPSTFKYSESEKSIKLMCAFEFSIIQLPSIAYFTNLKNTMVFLFYSKQGFPIALNCNTIAFTQRYRCCSRPCQTMIHVENIWKCRDRCVMTPITKSVVDTSSAEGKAGSSLRKLKRLKR